MELLMMAEGIRQGDKAYAEAYLRNFLELAYVIGDCYKPLLSLVNGLGSACGGTLALLANRSCAYEHSEVKHLFIYKYGSEKYVFFATIFRFFEISFWV